ncbi:MAG: GNAT family N-acetyltransferase [Hyphomicrobiaceae bacterium]|nr:GNAT family N-acetyltransferase [Hyphomicrobiaceae bacterium]
MPTNSLGQPIGEPVPDWRPVSPPPRTPMEGTFCRVEPLDIDAHGSDLFKAFRMDTDDRNWTYLGYGPFETEAGLRDWMATSCLGDDPFFHAIVDNETNKAVGVASYLRIEPAVGVIETGHIHYSPLLQRRPAATETMFLMMRRVFSELGYRRYEWKCDALNAPSRHAAERLGFRFEGIFRQATVYKGRNRDSAWYSILDSEWPMLEHAFCQWLDPANFDERGQQNAGLASFMEYMERAEPA